MNLTDFRLKKRVEIKTEIKKKQNDKR